MLRKRLITVLAFNDGVLFRTKLFTPDYRYTHNFVDAWSVDEVVILDVTRPGQGERANFEAVVKEFAHGAFVPLAAGGGIRSLDDVRRLMALGADKVVVNTGAIDNPQLISDIAKLYGSQCVVVSIDAKRSEDGAYEVMAEFGSRATGMTPAHWAKRAVEFGAGEILVTSIERDGSLEGYELALGKQVVEAVDIPVILCGGAGNWGHFKDGFEQTGVDAVCTANIYHFTESAIRSAKQYLDKAGIHVRTK